LLPFFLKRVAKVRIIFKPPNFSATFFKKIYTFALEMVSLWEIFWIFAKIGAFTIGGGIPMIAAIKSELTKRKWLKDEDFLDIITIAQTAPGLFAANIAILTGHRLRGTKGSIVATIASCLPPFLIILLIAIFFTGFKDNEYVIRAFKGIRPVVVALIGVPMIDMIKATKMRWWSWIIVVASMTLVCFLKVSPIYILICVIVVALFISWHNNRRAMR
jgi:chromate transporter